MKKLSILLLIFSFEISSCKQLGLGKENDSNLTNLFLAYLFLQPGKTAQIVDWYADLAYLTYSDSVTTAEILQEKVEDFIGASGSDIPSPTQAGMDAVKSAWLEARPFYLQTEVFRFANGPINQALDSRLPDSEMEGLLNAWPLDEDFLECVITNSSTTSEITKAKLLEVNSSTTLANCTTYTDSAKNVSIGWHAIEYLLWGSDTANNSVAGSATVADFQGATADSTQEKRRQYLRITTSLLVDHLKMIRDKWNPKQSGNYVSGFKSKPSQSISDIFTGLATFAKGEWGGERLKINTSNDQEDEHSCFSDNTKADFYFDAQGVVNLFQGSYTSYEGKSYNGTGVKAISGSLKSKLEDNLNTSRDAFCLNVGGSTMTLDSSICPDVPFSISSKFDNLSSADQDNLNSLQILIGITIANDFQTVAKKNGISYSLPEKRL